MNYKHLFHAGNFADVVKHVILVALIDAMSRKPSPFCYIDTHAGPGFYDLLSIAGKTNEYENGIEKVIRQEEKPPLVKRYIDCVHQINNRLTGAKFASLRYYPGSPYIARALVHPKDRIIACELQMQEYQALRAAFLGDKQVAVHHMDGFLGLKAFLPPPERRGLILIDPPYEDPDEFTRIVHAMTPALKRFETGVYTIWYPIKERVLVERFYRAVKDHIKHPVLSIEITIYPDLPNHLNGCGMIIINPPWQLDKTVQDLLPWLWKVLTINDQGGYKTFMLNK